MLKKAQRRDAEPPATAEEIRIGRYLVRLFGLILAIAVVTLITVAIDALRPR